MSNYVLGSPTEMNGTLEVDGYTIDLSGGVSINQVLKYNGSSFTASDISPLTNLTLTGSTLTLSSVASPIINASGTNNGGIIIQKQGARAFRTAGVGETAGQLWGSTDNVLLQLVDGAGSLLTYINAGSASTVGVAIDNISFKTANTERARFDTASFRPSGDAIFKNGNSGSRWSETWTQNLIADTITLDGYSMTATGSVTGNALVYNGSSYTPQAILSSKANANDFQLTTTSATDVLSFTPSTQGNYIVYVFYRVANTTTNVGINVTWTDGAGASTSVVVPATTSTVTGSYNTSPVYINATAAAIKVTATAGTANNLYVSASIVGIN
jgi:hypothetical protein